MSKRLVVAILVSSLLVIGFTNVLMAGASDGSIEQLNIAIGIDPDSLDPIKITTTLPGNITAYVCQNLVRTTGEGEVEPQLAKNWSRSADGLEWTFKLREGVRFQDDTPFNAEAVKKNFDRVLNPDIAVPQRSDLGPLKKVETVGEYKVKFFLEKPYGPFLKSLSSTVATIVSPKAIAEYGKELGDNIVGTGPYSFVNWRKGKEIILEKNTDYWGEPSNVEKIKFEIVTEASTREMMLKAGDVDIAYMPPATDVPSMKKEEGIRVRSVPSTRMMYVYLHNERGPTLKKKVRQAMNYALNKKAIVEKILMGQGTPVNAPLASSIFGYSETGYYEYNPDKARKLLEEAGYSDGFKVKFLHPSGRYMLDKKVAQAIQSYLSKVGIEVEMMTMDWPSVIKHLVIPEKEDPPQDLEFLGWGPLIMDAHFAMHPLFHSSQQPPDIANTGFYTNDEVDRLLEEALSETESEKRERLYGKASELIWEDAPMLFLYVQNFVLAHRSDLKGIEILPTEEFFVDDARIAE